jgi:hypothetical protein
MEEQVPTDVELQRVEELMLAQQRVAFVKAKAMGARRSRADRPACGKRRRRRPEHERTS